MPILLNKIKEFGNLAGFYLNKEKSNLMCKNMSQKKQEELINKTGCRLTKKAKYLGVELTMKNIDL